MLLTETESSTDLRKIPNIIENVLNIGYNIKINKDETEVMVYNKCEHKELQKNTISRMIQGKIEPFTKKN